MEEDKANPSSSQPPTPVPSGPQDQPLSWHLVGAESASVRPQRDTEEEQGPFVIREAERKPAVDEEPCQGRDTRPQELCLWEEATGRELSQWVPAVPVQEVSLCRMWSPQGLKPWRMGVSVEWGDGAQQLLYRWQQRVEVQELPHGEEEGNDPKLSQRGEGSASGQKNQPCSPAPSEEVPSAGAWSLVPAAHSSWEYTGIFSFRVPPSLPKAAAWDGVSVLEVREEGRRRSLAALAADELPPPVPREAWAERPAREPLCASLPPLQGRAATGPAASPVLAWQEPGPAPQSPRGPSAAPSKRPGRLRRALRALRALFRCRCLAPRTLE